MRRTPSFAVLCAFGLVGAIGARMWMDVRGSMDDVSAQTAVRAVDERRAVRTSQTTRDGAVNVEHNDLVANGPHIGEHIDPEADYIPREWQPKHIGDWVDPDAPVDFGGDRVVSHIGRHLDPNDDGWRPGPNASRHIGERQEPDFPPLVQPSASHIGERMEPPGE